MIFCKRKKKRVLVLWYSVDENLGDYFLFKTISNYLEKWGYDVRDMDVGCSYKEILKVARKCDFLWFAGGGIIERGLPDIVLNFKEFHARSHNIKYGVTGLSIGEFDYSDKEKALEYWVKQSVFFYTRDQYSADELNRLSNSNKVIESVDVVFALDLPDNIKSENKYFGINFRNLPYVDLSGEFMWDKWDSTIKNVIGKDVIGIPDQFDVSENVSFQIDSGYSPYKALDTIAKCEFALCMRYHAVLLGARLGKIFIPICYCPKVERLADQLDISELKLGVHDYDKLREKIEYLELNKSDLKERIRKNVLKYEKRAKEMFETVKDEIERGIK